jgi:hypothetical protein
MQFGSQEHMLLHAEKIMDVKKYDFLFMSMFVLVGCLQIVMDKTQILRHVLKDKSSAKFVAHLEHRTSFFTQEAYILIFGVEIFTNTGHSEKNKYKNSRIF